MRTGRLSESVSFEIKEKKVRESLSPKLIKKLDDLQSKSYEAYVEFIEEDYKNLDPIPFWEEYVDAHGTPEQIEKLLKEKGTDKYSTKLQHVFHGLVNRVD
ncbi:hypothetical protein ACXM1Q_000200 [Streptococcus sp. 10F2]